MSRLIGTDDPAAWRRALDGVAHGYWHTWEANRALELGLGDRLFLYADEAGDGTRAACTFAERHHGDTVDIYTPAGFAGFVVHGDRDAARARWRELVAARGYVCGYFALHPLVADPGLHEGVASANTLYVVDLAGGADAVFARADRYVRRALRDFARDGARIVSDRAAVRGFIVDNYAPFMASVGAHPRTVLPRATVAAMCEDEGMLLLGVADDDGLCAAYSVAMAAACAEAHINIGVRDGRRFNTALVCHAIEALAARGIPWLNLGGGVRPDDAVAQAKQKFRPVAHPQRVAREIYRPERYAQLCAAAGRDASVAAGFFPAYRA
jgi:hypothetical protein